MSSPGQPASGEPVEALELAVIERSERDGVRIVVVAGELDVSNVGGLEDATRGISNEALGVVVDLRGATYIDSATIGILFKLHRRLRGRGQVLRVICVPGSNTWRVLELTGFDRRLRAEQDREAAIDAIRAAVPLGDEGATS
jgi:anti-anti-sigma factor